MVDGDVVPPLDEDEDWCLSPLIGRILPPLWGIKFPLLIIRELFGNPLVGAPGFILPFVAPLELTPFTGVEVAGSVSIWSMPLLVLPPFGTIFNQHMLPNPEEGCVKS